MLWSDEAILCGDKAMRLLCGCGGVGLLDDDVQPVVALVLVGGGRLGSLFEFAVLVEQSVGGAQHDKLGTAVQLVGYLLLVLSLIHI